MSCILYPMGGYLQLAKAETFRAAERAKERYAEAQKVLTSREGRAEALNDLLRAREARRLVRSVEGATFNLLPDALDGFAWIAGEQRAAYREAVAAVEKALAHKLEYEPKGRFSSREERRRDEAHKAACANVKRIAGDIAYQAIAERLATPAEREEWGELTGAAVKAASEAHGLRLARRRAVRTVREYPALRAELERRSEEAQENYLHAFDVYEQIAA